MECQIEPNQNYRNYGKGKVSHEQFLKDNFGNLFRINSKLNSTGLFSIIHKIYQFFCKFCYIFFLIIFFVKLIHIIFSFVSNWSSQFYEGSDSFAFSIIFGKFTSKKVFPFIPVGISCNKINLGINISLSYTIYISKSAIKMFYCNIIVYVVNELTPIHSLVTGSAKQT